MVATLTRRDPRSIAHYDFIERIGKGGMGTVYRANDRQSGTSVAVKVLAPEVAENPKLYDRFITEFQSAVKLDHPNVVRALDFGLEDGKAYLVMEFIDGITLSDMIIQQGALCETNAVRIVTQIAQALHYAHRRRIIHRDVKPDNILIRADGLSKLADFGLAKDYDDDQDLTKPCSGLGTPHFMAPEQYEDAKSAGVLCDVYSLGATLYCAVTGRVPFDDCASLIALTRKLKGEIAPPRELVPELSPRVDEAIRLAMSPNPRLRPASILQFVKLLPSRQQSLRAERLSSRKNPRPSKMISVVSQGHERRAAVRHLISTPSSCTIDIGAVGNSPDAIEDWPATVQDLSVSGLGLVLGRRFEIGTLFSVQLDADAVRKSSALLVRVARVHPETLGHWFHGCSLVKPLTQDELMKMRWVIFWR